jgi:hypothetical protein
MINKLVLVMIFLLTAAFSKNAALFAQVTDVKQYDTLNVRAEANYKTSKVGEIPPKWYVGVEKCKKIRSATWCRVYPLVQQWSEHFGENDTGWVNARYLKSHSEGFVTVKGYEKNCHYALECVNKKGKEQCLVVLDYDREAKWIPRSLLRGESQFGAAPVNMDGYCTKGAWLDPYLKKSKQVNIPTEESDMKNVVNKLLEALEKKDAVKQITDLIHPEEGIILTEMVRFGNKEDKLFSKASFLNAMYKNDKLFWGYTYARGDKIVKTLPEYFNDLHRERKKVTKIVPLQTLKGFSSKGYGVLQGIEVYWINEASETKEYDYLGMVVILSRYKGKWHIVGLLRDRWTI